MADQQKITSRYHATLTPNRRLLLGEIGNFPPRLIVFSLTILVVIPCMVMTVFPNIYSTNALILALILDLKQLKTLLASGNLSLMCPYSLIQDSNPVAERNS